MTILFIYTYNSIWRNTHTHTHTYIYILNTETFEKKKEKKNFCFYTSLLFKYNKCQYCTSIISSWSSSSCDEISPHISSLLVLLLLLLIVVSRCSVGWWLIIVVVVVVDVVDDGISWVFECFDKWSERIKRLPHFGHAKRFSPVCVRIWRCNSSERVNALPQKSQLQRNGRSPACQRRWAFKCDVLP